MALGKSQDTIRGYELDWYENPEEAGSTYQRNVIHYCGWLAARQEVAA